MPVDQQHEAPVTTPKMMCVRGTTRPFGCQSQKMAATVSDRLMSSAKYVDTRPAEDRCTPRDVLH